MIKLFLKYISSFSEKKTDTTWWAGLTCSSCAEALIQAPNSHCGHCKRTICEKCGYIPGGCGWCGG